MRGVLALILTKSTICPALNLRFIDLKVGRRKDILNRFEDGSTLLKVKPGVNLVSA